MSKHKSSVVNLEDESSGPEMLMQLKNDSQTNDSDDSTEFDDNITKSKNKLIYENKEMKGKVLSNLDDTINNKSLDSNSDISSLKSSKKRKLLYNNIDYARKKVPKIGKFNVLNNNSNEITSSEYHSNSYNNESSIKSIRNRRLKVLYLKIPKHENGKYIKPKGISATKTIKGGFRIQLTLYTGKSEKYSKNTENFLDALWLFECAIILKDRPTMLSILLNSGNFAALLSYGIISNEIDYYEELGRWVCKFSKTSQMSDEDMKAIIYIYDNLVCCFQDEENGNFVTFPSLAQNGKTVTSILEPTRTNQIIELIQSNPDSLSI